MLKIPSFNCILLCIGTNIDCHSNRTFGLHRDIFKGKNRDVKLNFAGNFEVTQHAKSTLLALYECHISTLIKVSKCLTHHSQG